MDQLDLSAFFQTKDQANDFSSRLSFISERIYNTNFNLEKMLIDQFGIKKKDIFITLLRENKIDRKSNSNLKLFFESIIKNIATVPILSLTVAFEPNEKTLQALSQWCLLQINKQIVFEIHVDKSIIGGAIIDYHGKHMDYSIRPTFNQILNDVLVKKNPTIDIKEIPMHIRAEDVSI